MYWYEDHINPSLKMLHSDIAITLSKVFWEYLLSTVASPLPYIDLSSS